MSFRLKYDGDSYVHASTLGNILSLDTIEIVSNITMSSTNEGYFFTQCGSTSSTREFGLYVDNGNVISFLGGTQTTVDSFSNVFDTTSLSNSKVSFLFDFTTNTLTVEVDDVETYTGVVGVGTNRIDGMLFRLGARGTSDTPTDTGGGFTLVNGVEMGDTLIYLDGVLTRSYVSDGTGTTWEEVTNTQTGTVVNSAGDDSEWEFYLHWPSVCNSNSNTYQDTIVGPVIVNDSVVNANAITYSDVIALVADVISAVTPSQELYPSLLLDVGLSVYSGATPNSNANTYSSTVSLSSTVQVSDSVANSNANTYSSTITGGEFQVSDSVANSNVNTYSDIVSLSGAISVADTVASAVTNTFRDGIQIGPVELTDSVALANSVALLPLVTIGSSDQVISVSGNCSLSLFRHLTKEV